MMLRWAQRGPTALVSDSQALLGQVSGWLFSSNRRALVMPTYAAIRLLSGRAHIAAKLLQEFENVNDPYIAERIFATGCGVAMREPAGPQLQELAVTAHRMVFSSKGYPEHSSARFRADADRGCRSQEVPPVLRTGGRVPPAVPIELAADLD